MGRLSQWERRFVRPEVNVRLRRRFDSRRWFNLR
jgi:hypothetical protein